LVRVRDLRWFVRKFRACVRACCAARCSAALPRARAPCARARTCAHAPCLPPACLMMGRGSLLYKFCSDLAAAWALIGLQVNSGAALTYLPRCLALPLPRTAARARRRARAAHLPPGPRVPCRVRGRAGQHIGLGRMGLGSQIGTIR
jgi:hypothetical protein